MKLSIALLSAAVAASAAQPHRHGHQHLHKAKRDPVPDQASAYATIVPGPTEIVYVLNGQLISENDVQQGIKNGSLVYAKDGALEPAAPPTYAAPSTVAPTTTSTSIPVYVPPPTTSSKPAEITTTKEAPTSTKAAATSKAAAPSSYAVQPSSGSTWGSGTTGVDADFPDGQLDCSTFPSEYGAVAVPWTGLGGWTGIQSCGGSDASGYENIVTKIKGQTCSEGDFCSYACPEGYQKAQWPTTQGTTGQSVGGIKCSGGKLHLTNPSMSKKLCMRGADQVTIQIENKMTKNVAVCRTDYPGTESETIPVNALAGKTVDLTCPDADKYYKWKGGSTSAQYYVNPGGVSLEDGCQWGSEANPWGNFAPMNIGVGYSNGAAWLSIFQNAPTTDAKLDFCVEIKGDGVSGTCRYSNGQYCGGANYDVCSPTTGCTVSLTSGTATFVFSN